MRTDGGGRPGASGRPSPQRGGPPTRSGRGTERRSGGTDRRARGDERQDERGWGAPPGPPPDNKTGLYIGIGVGGVVLLIIIAVAMSGGDSGGGGRGGGVDRDISRAMEEAMTARNSGQWAQAYSILERIVLDQRYKKSSRYNNVVEFSRQIKKEIDTEREGISRTSDFKRRIDAAKADQTAMQKANAFWKECNDLIGAYSGVPAAMAELKNIKEDLRRWVATESQSDWQKDYNLKKDRIAKEYLAAENFSQAVNEWKRFKEISLDPLLHSRIEQELLEINRSAAGAAEKAVASAGSGADARTKLEEAGERFRGTDGQAIINKALRTLK